MIVAIHQPSYFPWLGLMHKIAGCDMLVVMDEVQLSDSLFQHRNLFLTQEGEAKYLSIPFVRKDYLHKRLRDIEIADPHWARRHRDFIWNNYRKHPWAAEALPQVEAFYAQARASLFEAIFASMQVAFGWFGLQPRVVLQSELEYDRSARRGDLVMALLKATGATCYLSGTGSRAYLDESRFGAGLALRYDEFKHPLYPQRNSREFVPGLACLDLVFNVGPAAARECLLTGNAS